MRIYLSGPMGAGKSTVASVLARRLHRPCVDLDGVIAQKAGKSVEAIFREHGESAFRAMERAELERIASGPEEIVVALGGGTVTQRPARRLALRTGLLVTLTAPVSELSARVATETGRPLLRGEDAQHVLEELLAERADAYAECHVELDTRGRPAEDVAIEVASLAHDPPVVVPLGQRTYRVHVGRGLRERAGAEGVRAASSRSALVVTDEGAAQWAVDVEKSLAAAGLTASTTAIPAGEQHKTLASVDAIWSAALAGGLDRGSLLVAVGGGVLGDLAGFAAATLYRGVSFGQVPTTLLAMVDSSVGGKNGFDRPEGKNLIGTIHQPRWVLCDVSALSTLPHDERRAGLAEVVKSAWLDGEGAVAQLEEDSQALSAGDEEATVRAIRMAVALKARIVSEDERETGSRRLLNLGHTVGHAIEAGSGYRVRHGEAVSLGMVAAFRVAERLGRAREAGQRLTRLLDAVGLPTDPTSHLDDHTLRFLGSDKKRAGSTVHFVVPGAPGETAIEPIALDELRSALSSS